MAGSPRSWKLADRHVTAGAPTAGVAYRQGRKRFGAWIRGCYRLGGVSGSSNSMARARHTHSSEHGDPNSREQEAPLMDLQKLAGSLDRIGALLVQGQYGEAGRLTKRERLTSAEIESAVTSYGRRLVLPPSGHFEPRSVFEIQGSQPRRWSVHVDLWTAEEGRSDLTLELTIRDSTGDAYDIEIDDIHVL